MGNSHLSPNPKVSHPSLPGQWIPFGRTDYCQLVKNTRTNLLAQQYHIPLDPRLTKQQNEEIYQQRRLQHDNLVTVYHIEKQTNQYLCQGKDFIVVKTQRMPYRLSEMNNLSFVESLYILRQAMLGYRAITDFYGAVSITDEMIGFTNDHRVKVWLNQEFAYNLPRENTQFLMRQPVEIEQKLPNTITQLFSVIEEHCENGQFPQQFSKAYRQYPIQTFSEALEFIHDYADKKGISLRNSLSSGSMVSAKTDYSVKEPKEKSQISIPITKPSFTSTLTINPSYTSSVPSSLASPQQFKMKIVEQSKLFTQVQPKKYYLVGKPSAERKFVTLAEKPKDYKLEFEKKPASNFTSTVSSNSNTINLVRKVSQNSNQGVYKLFSPRQPKVTYAQSTGGLRIPKPQSHKTTPTEFNFGQTHTKVLSSPSIIKPQEGVRYPIGQSYVTQPTQQITFKDVSKMWSPVKELSKERKLLPQKGVSTKELEVGLKSRYEKLSSETKSTVSGNLKVETIPKTISFNYSRGSKPNIKGQTK